MLTLKKFVEALVELSKTEQKKIELEDVEIDGDSLVAISGNSIDVSFIDGGNQTIVQASNFVLSAFRACVVNFSGDSHEEEIVNFYGLINFKDGKYYVKYNNDVGLPREIPASAVKVAAHPDFNAAAGLIRRLCELSLIVRAKNEFVVLDGSVSGMTSYEESYVNNAIVGKKKVYGLSKTTTITSKSGIALNAYSVLKKEGKWHLKLKEKNGLKVFYLKLHPDTKHLFRLDTKQEFSVDLVFTLSSNAKDPVFFGYPYGLILADQLARISNSEVELIKTNLMVECGKDWEDVELVSNTANAHEILDKINY